MKDMEQFKIFNTVANKKSSYVQFKNHVKESMKKVAFEYLISKRKSKLSGNTYNELKIQNYFTTNTIPTKRKILLFKARTRMLNVAFNYGNKSKCPLCKIGDDDQQHLIDCIVIKLNSNEICNNMDIKYEDIYTGNVEKQNKIIQLLEIAIRKRDEILDK